MGESIMAGMTDAEVFGTGGTGMSDAEVFGSVAAPQSGRSVSPANAGLANFGASVLGAPVDIAQGVLNTPTILYGIAKNLITGKAGPDVPFQNSFGGSESIRSGLRETRIPGLNPDNPNPQDAVGTAAYDLASRGGFIPGGVLPAIGSMIAEKIGGPNWANVGAFGPAAISHGISAVQKPTVRPQVDLLNKEGVSMTPGQILGGGTQRIEDAATSLPVLGDSIKAAQRRGIESFDVAALNSSLAPIGGKIPKGATVEQAVAYARMKLGDAYDNLLPNLKGDLNAVPASTPGTAVTVPGATVPGTATSFRQELDTIRSMGQNLPEPQRGQLGRIIDREILNRFTPSGLASGETLKNIESKLGELKRHYAVGDYDARTLAGAIDEAQAAMRRMVNTVNPEYQGQLAKINEGYANFKKVQAAAGNIGMKDSVFTPAQLQRAVRAGDVTKDKRAFSEGNALMQDLSSAGKSTLSQTVPDSGTPLRAALMYSLRHPANALGLGLPVGIASTVYSPTVQSGLQRLLTAQRSPPAAISLQDMIQQAIIANQQGKP